MNIAQDEIWTIEQEGILYIVTYRTIDGVKEKCFYSYSEAKQFTKTL
jgi:hypothetical protein